MSQGTNIEDFVSLLTYHQGKINSYILTLVPNYVDSADIMQETAKVMWMKFSDFKIGTDFLAWGLSIAHFRVLEYRRRKKNLKEIGLSDDVFEKLSSAAKSRQDKSSEQLFFLKKCFNLLNENDQRIILFRYHENLKSKEIAARLGKSVRNIYMNISRIQELLLHCIKKHSLEAEHGHA